MPDREILFRGKRLDNGAWVEGYYVKTSTGQAYILPKSEYISFEYQTIAIGGFVEAAPSTVSQYTGLTDKHGTKLFIGDIVNCSRGCPHEVVWLQEHGGTFVGGMPAVYLSGLREGYAWTGAEEVIGNRWDSELVGGDTNA